MKKRYTYQDALRAKGVKPLPPIARLRTVKRKGDKEQTPVRSIDDNGFVEIVTEVETPIENKSTKLRIVA
jgi:hypothetical protein